MHQPEVDLLPVVLAPQQNHLFVGPPDRFPQVAGGPAARLLELSLLGAVEAQTDLVALNIFPCQQFASGTIQINALLKVRPEVPCSRVIWSIDSRVAELPDVSSGAMTTKVRAARSGMSLLF